MRWISCVLTIILCRKIFSKKRKQEINMRYLKQQKLIQKEWKKIRKIKHDMGNRYALELGYLESGQYDKLRKIYIQMLGEIEGINKITRTGNEELDMLIAYKCSLAKTHEIETEVKAKLSGTETVCAADISTVLGNLFDNAIEACCEEVKEKRWVHLEMVSDATAVLIRMSNPYRKLDRGSDGKIVSGKKDKANHGIGLKAIKEIVDKYRGNVEIKTENGVFEVKVLLYILND